MNYKFNEDEIMNKHKANHVVTDVTNNIIHGVKQYSYSSFSVGYSFNFKSGRKISDEQRTNLDSKFKLFK